MQLIEIFDFTSSVQLTNGIMHKAAHGFGFMPGNEMPELVLENYEAEEMLSDHGMTEDNFPHFIL